MERPVKTEDITSQVMAFLQHDPGPSGEQAVTIPGMTVSCLDGSDLTASRHVQTFDGCHPYEYDELTDYPRFAVQSLLVSRRSTGVFLTKEIRSDAGLIATDDAALTRYRFEAPQEGVRSLSDNETAFRQTLEHLTFLTDQPAERLISYRSRLLASAADPLDRPVSIPARSQYGTTKPLWNTPVSQLSLYTPADGPKQIGLTVSEPYTPEQTLEFIPFEAVRLTFERRTNQPAAILRKALALSRNDGSPETLVATIRQYNESDKYGYWVIPHVYRRTDHLYSFTSRAFMGRYENDRLTDVRPLEKPEYTASFPADRLIQEPASGQLYLVDQASGTALSAQDAQVLNDMDTREAVYNRELWLR